MHHCVLALACCEWMSAPAKLSRITGSLEWATSCLLQDQQHQQSLHSTMLSLPSSFINISNITIVIPQAQCVPPWTHNQLRQSAALQTARAGCFTAVAWHNHKRWLAAVGVMQHAVTAKDRYSRHFWGGDQWTAGNICSLSGLRASQFVCCITPLHKLPAALAPVLQVTWPAVVTTSGGMLA